MMMGPGIAQEGPITELHLSAISEAMNQMMGSASTSLSTMLNKVVDISAPKAMLIQGKQGWIKELDSEMHEVVIISFRMEIENTLDSNIAQIMSVKFARELIDSLNTSNV